MEEEASKMFNNDLDSDGETEDLIENNLGNTNKQSRIASSDHHGSQDDNQRNTGILTLVEEGPTLDDTQKSKVNSKEGDENKEEQEKTFSDMDMDTANVQRSEESKDHNKQEQEQTPMDIDTANFQSSAASKDNNWQKQGQTPIEMDTANAQSNAASKDNKTEGSGDIICDERAQHEEPCIEGLSTVNRGAGQEINTGASTNTNTDNSTGNGSITIKTEPDDDGNTGSITDNKTEPDINADDSITDNKTEPDISTGSITEKKTEPDCNADTESIDTATTSTSAIPDDVHTQADKTGTRDKETEKASAKLRNAEPTCDDDKDKVEEEKGDQTDTQTKGKTLANAESTQAEKQNKNKALAKLRNAEPTYDDDEEEREEDNWQDYNFNEKKHEACKQFVYFWKNESVFSQWHRSMFYVDGIAFSSAEQYMMYKKADLFEDNRVKNKILYTTDPRKVKRFGRQVSNFHEGLWRENCLYYVKEANVAKFTQNDHMLKTLFATDPKILVEASPFDQIWGIGLDEHSPGAFQQSTWQGLNLLGFILTEVRDELMCECGLKDPKDKKVYVEALRENYCASIQWEPVVHQQSLVESAQQFSDLANSSPSERTNNEESKVETGTGNADTADVPVPASEGDAPTTTKSSTFNNQQQGGGAYREQPLGQRDKGDASTAARSSNYNNHQQGQGAAYSQPPAQGQRDKDRPRGKRNNQHDRPQVHGYGRKHGGNRNHNQQNQQHGDGWETVKQGKNKGKKGKAAKGHKSGVVTYDDDDAASTTCCGFAPAKGHKGLKTEGGGGGDTDVLDRKGDDSEQVTIPESESSNIQPLRQSDNVREPDSEHSPPGTDEGLNYKF